MPAASFSTISNWFDKGKDAGNAYMIVWCDNYDMDDYVSYHEEKEWAQWALDHPDPMQRAMECYDLKADKDTQMNMRRAWALTRKV